MKIDQFKTDRLNAWNDKDVERLIGFYARDAGYEDAQTTNDLHGREQHGIYLKQLFSSTPIMNYKPHETLVIEGDFCEGWCSAIWETNGDGRQQGFESRSAG